MASLFASLFRKRVGCPSSQSLLAYDQSRLGFQQMRGIETHLAYCDFCNAELQLLTRHQNNRDEYAFAEMPIQLRSLAERLLKTSVAPFGAFQQLEENHKI